MVLNTNSEQVHIGLEVRILAVAQGHAHAAMTWLAKAELEAQQLAAVSLPSLPVAAVIHDFSTYFDRLHNVCSNL